MADWPAYADAFAENAHRGQFDKCGVPYIEHPRAVAARVEGDAAKCAALLHDVVEDTYVTLAHLRAHGFSDEVVDAVDALSRRDGEVYADFIERIALNPLAVRVKLADLEENMRPDRRHPSLEGLSKRYLKAKARLEQCRP